MSTEYSPEQETIAPGEIIKLRTRFGGLSRGRCWGKCYPGKSGPIGDFEWVPKEDGTLFLTQPGYYIVGSSDGFRRSARVSFQLREATEKQHAVNE